MGHARKVLVTGATGFVGRRLLEVLNQQPDTKVLAAVRQPQNLQRGIAQARIAGLDPQTDWQSALTGVTEVVHLASRVHVMNETVHDPLKAFRKVNVAGTLALAEQAANAGVKRFIFISTIKVNGERTEPGQPFTHQDRPAPQDPYGISKAEAEAGLRQLARNSAMEVVILRPPLIYGPGVKANFARMVRWVQRGVPLPLGRTNNLRSLLALDNLVDLIITCLSHPRAGNQTFLVSDGEDVSTTVLLQKIAGAMGTSSRLLPVPSGLVWVLVKVLRREDIYQRLFSSLQLDSSFTRQTLDWTPPLSLDQGLQQVVTGPH
ncbi:MAG: SDR family oxidoreductase [Halomonadaceae bacterium]|nr:MAG: SDR family oxidoreductase [Halomonadaceae bacterium]